MDPAKVIKTSQFSFDNLSGNPDPSKPKIPPKSTNLASLPPANFDKSRLASISTQNRISGTYIQEKAKSLKSPSPLPGLSNEKKVINVTLKGAAKKLPLKIPSSSPLTAGREQAPYSGQIPQRRLDLFEPKPKEFRVRTGSSQAKMLTDTSSVHSSSRHHRESSAHQEKSTNSFDNGDLILEKNRTSELARVNLAPVIQHREGLPLLIVHFEGVIGSCLVKVNETGKDKNKEAASEPAEFFIRKGAKSELKVWAKKFLIVVVLPSFEGKYKKVAKHLVSSKFHIDGIYYNAKADKHRKFPKIDDFTLNYNKILEDFRERVPDRRIVLLLPVNVSSKMAKGDLLLKEPKNEAETPKKRRKEVKYDERQFLHFFPKFKTNTSNLKIVCVPNFAMGEKNERCTTLLKSSFYGVGKMIEFIHQEIAEPQIPIESGMEKHGHHHSPAPLASISLNQLDPKPAEESHRVSKSKDDIEEEAEVPVENKENRMNKKNDAEVYSIDLDELISKIEKKLEMTKKWQKINRVKQAAYSNEMAENPQEFDLATAKQKIIESLIETQKSKGYSKGNIMHHFLVGDLFSRNNHLFKFYEKDTFYMKRAFEQIRAISRGLESGFSVVESMEVAKRKERAAFESAPLNSKIVMGNTMSQNLEEESEVIDLLLIRRQAKAMQLYLGD